MRPSWDSYFLDVADLVATRATCPRRSVGAVLVQDKRIVATGYNGSLPGEPHCSDPHVGCLMVDGHCKRTTHAEVNALLQGAPARGATIYVTDRPCAGCLPLIAAAGVVRAVFRRDYRPEIRREVPGVELVHLPAE